MRKTKAVTVNEKTYVARELTPLDIDGLCDVALRQKKTIVDDFLDVHFLDAVLLGAMLDVPPEHCAEIIGGLTTSEYMPIIEAAKEMNPDFFVMARRRVELAGQLDAISRMLASASEKASPSSLTTDTSTPGTTE
jgi:hypothetical protein